jgi:thiamine biosynthesis lipoprotein
MKSCGYSRRALLTGLRGGANVSSASALSESLRPALTKRSESKGTEFLVRAHRRIMACRVEVVLPGEFSEQLEIASRALDEADRLEEVMTIFRETSEVTRVNQRAHEGPVTIGDELTAVLRQAAELSDATGGAFDITSKPLSECWGFLRREGRLPPNDAILSARENVGMHLVELDPRTQTVHFRRQGVALNLGSIGKGFALDRMGHFLRHNGVDHALISAGSSSILAIGGTPDPWEIDLRSMVSGERLARLRVSNGAVGTSGAGEQFFEVDGVRYGHVIDPRTGWPAAGVLSASVIASNAAAADALSTAFLIGGADLAERYCASHPGVLAIITPDVNAGPNGLRPDYALRASSGSRRSAAREGGQGYGECRPLMFGSYLAASVELS